MKKKSKPGWGAEGSNEIRRGPRTRRNGLPPFHQVNKHLALYRYLISSCPTPVAPGGRNSCWVKDMNKIQDKELAAKIRAKANYDEKHRAQPLSPLAVGTHVMIRGGQVEPRSGIVVEKTGERTYRVFDGQKTLVITAFPETGSHSAFLKLLQNEFDIWKEGVLAETDMFVSPDKLSYLLGLLKAVQIPHKVQEVDIKSLIEKEKDYLSRRGETFDFKGFYKYHEILEFLTDLARHTEGMDVIEMQGTTYEGRPIKGVRINPARQVMLRDDPISDKTSQIS
ncbi:unnamed protein product [Cyprideis torosa]|uniref:Uncharacterized protein n=1 Tax=Cyprideis torosa TaxID=163714 RepID=A0A7R8WPG9_9CRUS|nr:unnamed protein product [Cyprideis torosa]CAG0900727.1 unnamed protein product [Cyprideis torosa]